MGKDSAPRNRRAAKPSAKLRQRPAAAHSRSANPAEGKGVPFPIAGIGMSAGGLEAATEFLKAMPSDSGMGFVIVQHLEPTRKSLLAELLGKYTSMPVIEIADGMAVQANHVYVIVPAQTLSINGGVLRLSDPVEPRGRRHPIDHFLAALATDRKTGAIAIVLSGAGRTAPPAFRTSSFQAACVLPRRPRPRSSTACRGTLSPPAP